MSLPKIKLARLLEEYQPFVIDAEEKILFQELHDFVKKTKAPYDRKKERHITASVIVINQTLDKVLLVFSKKYKQWFQPGGHLERGEDPFLGAKRELKEETGIDGGECFSAIFDIDIHRAIHTDEPSKTFAHLDLRFLCIVDDGTPLRGGSREI